MRLLLAGGAERMNEDALRRFIYSQVRGSRTPADDDDLIDKGLMDSLGVVNIGDYLEEQFDIRIAADEFTIENLGSISRVLAFVRRKHATA